MKKSVIIIMVLMFLSISGYAFAGTDVDVINSQGQGQNQSLTNINAPKQVVGQSVGQSLNVESADNPTNYRFAEPAFFMLPAMTHDGIKMAWNTAASIWDFQRVFSYTTVSGLDSGKVATQGQSFSTSSEKSSSVKVYMSTDEIVKDFVNGYDVTLLFVGATHYEKEDGTRLQCEAGALKKATEVNGNAILVSVSGFNVAHRTGGKQIGVGANGTWLERLGTLAIGLPVNFAWANVLADGYAKPFISYYVLQIKGK
jgi:hypothetical protein